jgi:hypothetical protein
VVRRRRTSALRSQPPVALTKTPRPQPKAQKPSTLQEGSRLFSSVWLSWRPSSARWSVWV